jgi:hypothetical protein
MVNPVPASRDYLELIGRRPRELRRLMAIGERPDPAALAGYEYRGTNTPPSARLLGIRRFVKGFRTAPDGSVTGYNKRVRGSDLSAPWTTTTMRGLGEFGFFTVASVDPEVRDNRHLNALLLDYGAGANPRIDISRVLRDYLVRVDRGSDDVLLGQAYAAIGPSRIMLGHFVLERL